MPPMTRRHVIFGVNMLRKAASRAGQAALRTVLGSQGSVLAEVGFLLCFLPVELIRHTSNVSSLF